jgi:hemerythrin superfamily protein
LSERADIAPQPAPIRAAPAGAYRRSSAVFTREPTMPRSTAKPMDAIALLKNDHRTVEDLFERFEKSRVKSAKEKIAKLVCLELMVHSQIEEEIFYPAVKDAVDEEIYTEAYVEHDGAKVLIAEILAGSVDEEFYDAKVKVLSEMIKHHVKEEEQRDGMFAQARKAKDVDMEALGAAMAARKEEIVAKFRSEGVPPPTTRSMKGAELERGEPVEA